MDVSNSKRIVLLGKTGSGKSSLANTILGGSIFSINHHSVSDSAQTRAETRLVHGRSLTLVDTCSLFSTNVSEALQKEDLLRCITECAPGPHAFIVVLKVEKFTEQEEGVVQEIMRRFSLEALKYTTVVFTHGDQLLEGMTIREFISENQKLRDLARRCGDRCHVVDNKYWKRSDAGDYRSNRFQVSQLLGTIDKIIQANEGRHYTNQMLEGIQREIQVELSQQVVSMSPAEAQSNAKRSVASSWAISLAGVATAMVLEIFLGVTNGDFDQANIVSSASGWIARGYVEGMQASAGATSPVEAVQKVFHNKLS